ncbi:GNAT family N-acetyltransferase [Sphingobacterium thalpophilum]|uniref:Acetyltransferase (GNAT) family n=1 Tax=Sphingobacterium thalpophilum TaxID=259 RepID=A0A4U9VM53_9SPHI|nr:GNAT family protein [Sphingobacterium thalpophilum]VTR48310.1 Acetyltransferase (GNAT) family [Sphingobacterium thalpophilum]
MNSGYLKGLSSATDKHTLNLVNDQVVLCPLTEADADFFYAIYSHPQLAVNFDESPFLENETAIGFTKRIISVCEYNFTIRSTENPQIIIGDCALHHWDQTTEQIAIGGSLLPEYWGKGFMQAAFGLLFLLAKENLGVKSIVAVTTTRNHKAIRLAEKMGFKKIEANEVDTVLRKEL